MSEYQYVYFAAVDRQLDDKQLAYMERQSTRAEVTRWRFENEYHYGDFRGDALEMMRRGFDVHVHYANFGIRKLMFRLPVGLPMSLATFKLYQKEYGLEWKKDAQGKGGVLCIEPEADAGSYDEVFFEFHRLIAELPKIRQSLIEGDCRTIYLAWLACTFEEEAIEPPVPAGLSKLPRELKVLAEFYAISEDLIRAAAAEAPALPVSAKRKLEVDEWLTESPSEKLHSLLRRVVEGDGESVRAEALAEIRDRAGQINWPMSTPNRSFDALQELAIKVKEARHKREAASRDRAQQKRFAAIRKNPNDFIREAERLVETRSTDNYLAAAKILAELREALGPAEGPKLANAAAKKLVQAYPTLSYLKKSLREKSLEFK